MRHITLATVVFLAGLASTASAFAHAHLVSAHPPVGGTVKSVPIEVAIQFSEVLEARFSSIEVQNAQGQRVDDGGPHLAPSDAKHFAVRLKPLSPGIYKVIWHATSVDTHKTNGTYQFTVEP